MGNNTQDPNNTRVRQMDPIPLDTTINVPSDGVIYDLFNGGTVPVADGKAPLHLAAGDGACWLHLPAAPGAMKLDARAVDGNALQINLTWGTTGYLPFRLRLYDPAGNKIDDLYRATTPVALKKGATHHLQHALSAGRQRRPRRLPGGSLRMDDRQHGEQKRHRETGDAQRIRAAQYRRGVDLLR